MGKGYEDLPDDLKAKLMSELDGASSGDDEKLLILEEQNAFVEKFVRQKKINLRFDGSIDWRENPGISRDVFITKVQQDYRIFAAKYKVASPNRLGRNDLQHQLMELLYDNRAEKQLRLENMLRYREDVGDAELIRFVKALFPNASKEKLAFSQTVIECFIWQVKRKIAGIPVEHHIMPVLYSKQHGTGKSVSMGRLMNPLKEFVLHLQLDVFKDSFFRKAFSENFVVIFDELQGAGRTDIESMKNVITAEDLSARGMRTQDIDTIKQNCTFVGTTNRPLADLIFDNTGMRRFVELELDCMADLELITGEKWVNGERLKATNPIDFLKVWQGVKELTLNPILAIKEELEQHQEQLRTMTTLEQWVDEFEVEPGKVENNVQVLFNHYKDWMELQRKQPGMINKFNKDLKSLGFGDVVKRVVGGNTVRLISLNKDISGLKTQ